MARNTTQVCQQIIGELQINLAEAIAANEGFKEINDQLQLQVQFLTAQNKTLADKLKELTDDHKSPSTESDSKSDESSRTIVSISEKSESKAAG